MTSVPTFSQEHDLPSLPLPSLNATLNKYLESVSVFLNREEYAQTKEIVDKFANGVGRELNSYLMDKVKNEKNWVGRN
jgi:hypothetical protein